MLLSLGSVVALFCWLCRAEVSFRPARRAEESLTRFGKARFFTRSPFLPLWVAEAR
jgi:hypothetical protein